MSACLSLKKKKKKRHHERVLSKSFFFFFFCDDLSSLGLVCVVFARSTTTTASSSFIARRSQLKQSNYVVNRRDKKKREAFDTYMFYGFESFCKTLNRNTKKGRVFFPKRSIKVPHRKGTRLVHIYTHVQYDDDVVRGRYNRVSHGAPVGAVPRFFQQSGIIQLLFLSRRPRGFPRRVCRTLPSPRTEARGTLPPRREKRGSPQPRKSSSVEGGPIGRRRELFRPLLGASFLGVRVRVRVLYRSFLKSRVFKEMSAGFRRFRYVSFHHSTIRFISSTFFRRRRYVYIYIYAAR